MSDRGVSPFGSIGKSHTSTTEWQSFEVRMRRRRAERCLARADLALKAGCIDDAQAATDEARALEPAMEGIARMDLVLAESRARAHTRLRRGRTIRQAVIASSGLVLAAVTWTVWQTASPGPQPPQAGDHRDIVLAAPVPPERIETTDAPAAEVSAILSDPAPVVAREAAAIAPAAEGVSGNARNFSPAPELERSPAPTALVRPRVEAPVPSDPAPPPTTGVSPSVPVSRAVAQVAPVVRPRTPPAELRPPSDLPPPSAAPSVVSDAAAARVRNAESPAAADAQTGIRATLARFEAAYSGLDASAAHDVWPAVNQRALAHAFDGLVSQRVSLGKCDVSLNGARARATCSGRAEWTPKVGGGERTESRQWTFDLESADGDWRITRASAQ